MAEHANYDYQELAYDLYHAEDVLLEKLVNLRRKRGMTQANLAEEMNVSQGYVSKIENGCTDMISKLTDYALEVGARLHYEVEPAEKHAEGDRAYAYFSMSGEVPVGVEWSDATLTMGNADKDVRISVRRGKSSLQITSIDEMNSPVESSVPSYETLKEGSTKEMANATH